MFATVGTGSVVLSRLRPHYRSALADQGVWRVRLTPSVCRGACSPTLFGVDDAPMVLAERRHRLAPPPWRIFAALTEEVDRWLTLRPREVKPRVVKGVPSSLVEWSSLWPVSPTDSIVFEIEPDGAGCAVTLRWSTSNPPDEKGIGLVRHRLNYAIGGELRDFVDTQG